MSQFGDTGLWVTLASLRAGLGEDSSEYWALPFGAARVCQCVLQHSWSLAIQPKCSECRGWRFIALCVYLECVTILTKTLPNALSILVQGAMIQIKEWMSPSLSDSQQISALSEGMLLFLKILLQAMSKFLLITVLLVLSMQWQSHKFLLLLCWLLSFIASVLIPKIWTPVGTLLMLILYRPTISKEVSGILRKPVLHPLFILWLCVVLG